MLLLRYLITILNVIGIQSAVASQLDDFKPWIPPGSMADPENPSSQPIKCDYSAMVEHGYLPSRPKGGHEWIRHKDDPSLDFNIMTDYYERTPTGITREYHITVNESDTEIWDGRGSSTRALADSKYPGPWIQACWGDRIKITVHNNLTEIKNGTSLHLHGFRLLDSNLVDGVPGVTQCPIAPGHNFTYIFNATQYGTSWYHSHYSLQYSNGLLGPITIHGPTSAEYDEPLPPLIVSDHNNGSAFVEYHMEQNGPPWPNQESILLNNHGNYAGQYPEHQFKQRVEKGIKYSLGLVNGATDSSFLFSIDGHNLTIIGIDLVAVEPYNVDHVRLGIGQRYHVILETREDIADESSFWIRTELAQGCNGFRPAPIDSRQGILWYSSKNDTEPTVPPTTRNEFPLDCGEATDFEPMVKWQVPPLPTLGDGSVHDMIESSISVWNWSLPKDTKNAPETYGWSWKFLRDTVWVDYENPSVNNVTGLKPNTWDHTAVIEAKPMNGSQDVWNYMLIVGGDAQKQTAGGIIVPAYHPMHLHGHDFVIIKHSAKSYEGYSSIKNLNLDNPPRRDTVLIPNGGYVLIAFKSDNPGVWVMHCHIAWHASAGLALQVVEGREGLEKQVHGNNNANLSPDDVFLAQQHQDTCKDWKVWQDKRIADLNAENSTERFRDESGI